MIYPLILVALFVAVVVQVYRWSVHRTVWKALRRAAGKVSRPRFGVGSLMAVVTVVCLVMGIVFGRIAVVKGRVRALEEMGVRFSEERSWDGVPKHFVLPSPHDPRREEINERLHDLGYGK